MAFFSLFYENQEQFFIAEEQLKNQVYVKPGQKKVRKEVFIGAQMVMVEEDCSSSPDMPGFFHDLNLEQIFCSRYGNKIPDHLKDVLFCFPRNVSTIIYRQDIYKDLDDSQIYDTLSRFYSSFSQVLRLLEHQKEADQPIQKSKYFIDAMALYWNTITELRNGLKTVNSTALLHMGNILQESVLAKNLMVHSQIAKKLQQGIEQIHCTLTLTGDAVKISFVSEQADYKKELSSILRTCESADNGLQIFNQADMNAFEKKLITLAEKENSSLFTECINFMESQDDFIDDTVRKFHQELEFYLSNKTMMDDLTGKGFCLSYPSFQVDYGITLYGICDACLAIRTKSSQDVVLNDFLLQKEEYGAWITGANQGGKTTFARSVGQTIYFAVLGLPVIASCAKLRPYRGIYTHFSMEENHTTLNGKLKEELLKLREITEKAPDDCFYILNELFSSTTATDAFDMSRLFVHQLQEKSGNLLCVTHIPALSMESNGMISLAAITEDEDNHKRTYRILRKEAEISAFAMDIADKYQLTGRQLKERLKHEA